MPDEIEAQDATDEQVVDGQQDEEANLEDDGSDAESAPDDDEREELSPEAMKQVIADLRRENAKWRHRAHAAEGKGAGSDDLAAYKKDAAASLTRAHLRSAIAGAGVPVERVDAVMAVAQTRLPDVGDDPAAIEDAVFGAVTEMLNDEAWLFAAPTTPPPIAQGSRGSSGASAPTPNEWLRDQLAQQRK